MAKSRVIMHLKMDVFYAAIEQRDDEKLQKIPIAVGDADRKRGAIAVASIEARKYGIFTSMATKVAKKKCPRLKIIPPRIDVYKAESRKVFKILHKYSDNVEMVSIDEAYLDLTDGAAMTIADGVFVAKRIKEEIKAKTELTACVGISYNKMLAKIATTMEFPDGTIMMMPQQAERFLRDIEVEKIPGIGFPTMKKLNRLGVKFGGELIQASKSQLSLEFGHQGESLYNSVRGIDETPVKPSKKKPKYQKHISQGEGTTEVEGWMKDINPVFDAFKKRIEESNEDPQFIRWKLRQDNFKVRSFLVNIDADFPTLDEAFGKLKQYIINATFNKKVTRLTLEVQVVEKPA